MRIQRKRDREFGQAVNSQMVGHHHHGVIRNTRGSIIKAPDRLNEPGFIFIGDGIAARGRRIAPFREQAERDLYAVTGTFRPFPDCPAQVISNPAIFDQSGIIGTTSQRLSAEYRGQDGRYGGRLVMDGVPYVFADQPLKNRNGEVVGYISFGLPEARFSDIVSDSRNLSLILAAVCVLCFAPLVWLVHTRLQRDRAALEL